MSVTILNILDAPQVFSKSLLHGNSVLGKVGIDNAYKSILRINQYSNKSGFSLDVTKLSDPTIDDIGQHGDTYRIPVPTEYIRRLATVLRESPEHNALWMRCIDDVTLLRIVDAGPNRATLKQAFWSLVFLLRMRGDRLSDQSYFTINQERMSDAFTSTFTRGFKVLAAAGIVKPHRMGYIAKQKSQRWKWANTSGEGFHRLTFVPKKRRSDHTCVRLASFASEAFDKSFDPHKAKPIGGPQDESSALSDDDTYSASPVLIPDRGYYEQEEQKPVSQTALRLLRNLASNSAHVRGISNTRISRLSSEMRSELSRKKRSKLERSLLATMYGADRMRRLSEDVVIPSDQRSHVNGRWNHPWVNVSRDYRKAWKGANGESIVNVDIPNSQPLFLAMLCKYLSPGAALESMRRGKLYEYLNHALLEDRKVRNMSDGVSKFVEDCMSGHIYDIVARKLDITRGAAKSAIFGSVFKDDKANYSTNVETLLSTLYPGLSTILSKLKVYRYQEASILLQHFEAWFMYTRVLPKVCEVVPDSMCVVPLHDSLFVSKDINTMVHQIMLGEFYLAFGEDMPVRAPESTSLDCAHDTSFNAKYTWNEVVRSNYTYWVTEEIEHKKGAAPQPTSGIRSPWDGIKVKTTPLQLVE